MVFKSDITNHKGATPHPQREENMARTATASGQHHRDEQLAKTDVAHLVGIVDRRLADREAAVAAWPAPAIRIGSSLRPHPEAVIRLA